MFVDMISFIFIIALLVFIIFIVKYETKKRKKILGNLKEAGLLKNLNSGGGIINGTSYKFQYFAGSKNSSPYFSISIEGNNNIPKKGFYIKKESKFDKFFKRIGLVAEIQTGDENFDSQFFIIAYDILFTQSFLSIKENRELIKSIFESGYNLLFVNSNKIEAKAKPIKNINTEKTAVEDIASKLIKLKENIPENRVIIIDETAKRRKLLRIITFALTILFFILGIIFFIIGLIKYKPLDLGTLLFDSLIYFGIISVLFLWFSLDSLKGRSYSHYEWISVALISMIGIFFLVSGIRLYINGKNDKSEIRKIDTIILKKYYSRSKNGTSYYLILQSWRKDKIYEKIKVSPAVYSKSKTEAPIVIYTKSGYLGYEWLIKYYLPDKTLSSDDIF